MAVAYRGMSLDVEIDCTDSATGVTKLGVGATVTLKLGYDGETALYTQAEMTLNADRTLATHEIPPATTADLLGEYVLWVYSTETSGRKEPLLKTTVKFEDNPL